MALPFVKSAAGVVACKAANMVRQQLSQETERHMRTVMNLVRNYLRKKRGCTGNAANNRVPVPLVNNRPRPKTYRVTNKNNSGRSKTVNVTEIYGPNIR